MTTKTETRLNDDGSLDEIVGVGQFHLEQMDDDEWVLIVNGVIVRIDGRVYSVEEHETESMPSDVRERVEAHYDDVRGMCARPACQLGMVIGGLCGPHALEELAEEWRNE